MDDQHDDHDHDHADTVDWTELARIAFVAAAAAAVWFRIWEPFARVSVLGGTLATLAVALALSQYSLARPLRRLADVMKSMARGEFASEIDGLARQDEVG